MIESDNDIMMKVRDRMSSMKHTWRNDSFTNKPFFARLKPWSPPHLTHDALIRSLNFNLIINEVPAGYW